MLVLLALQFGAASVAPVLVRCWGRRACYPLALAPAAALGWAVGHTARVTDGGAVVETYPWVPGLGLDLALRVTTLSWLMVVLVGGIGALVLVYCAGYFDADEPGLGRFVAIFVCFVGAMLGVVVADNLLLLYVFWELTSVCSYLLIGQHPEQAASRRAATQALIVTTLGGLAMLVGFILVGEHAGTYRWSEIEARPPSGGAYLVVAVLLIVAGVVTKSALFPASFWLPAAMAAPTPVSAYLHAAAMVKAGIYLVALLAPVYADVGPWRPLLFVAGAGTMLLGGWAALRQVDLKLLLAYGTISQLGMLTVLVAAGDPDAALAGTTLLLAHALFKATLFLVVGIVDQRAGTRDLTVLSGLWRRMPLVGAVALLAAASMAGVPPLLGFVAKEAVFEAFVGDPPLLAALVAGSALTAGYTARFVWGAFADRPGAEPTPTRPVEPVLLLPAAALAVAGLALGPFAGGVGEALRTYPGVFGATDHHLALWHGPGLALGLSATALAGGLLLFVLFRPVRPALARLRAPFDGDTAYQYVARVLDRLAVEVTGATQRGSLPQYLGIILLVLVVGPGGVLLFGDVRPHVAAHWENPLQAVVGVVLVVAAVLAVRARRRLTAVILVGLTGYGTGLLFLLHGAPEVALTQFLVETVTIVIFVLVLRRLPTHFSRRRLRRIRWGRIGLGLAVGTVMAGLVLVARASRQAAPVSENFPQLARDFGYGRNVVNVILVDIRAWDTLGEISVLVVAGTGVASLIFQFRRRPSRARRPDLPAPGPERVWLRAGSTLHIRRRSIVLEVVVRLIFHTIVIFSIFLLWSGHNGPGGGFTGGLVAGLALALRYLAGGRHELDQAAPVDASVVLGTGLLFAIGTGLLALPLGGQVLQSARVDVHLPLVGDVHLVTSVFFDIGVYLVVVGLALDILRSLGAEVDHQIEVEEAPGGGLRTSGEQTPGVRG
ncbi:Na+/H+ antiporter subunit A [Plantactinospora sp. B24E8]|uniref:Na+/H+ antiporter subunit A n=1 Tax=Plantactinospora sp. B24E8 TaxID=3153567 RepID=UPI00325F751A